MKRISRIALVSIISALLVISLASCQTSGEADAAEIVTTASQPAASPAAADVPPAPAAEPASPAAAPAESAAAPAAAPAEIPVELDVEYLGYGMGIDCYDGHATITYPAGIVTDADVEAFLAAESAKYGAQMAGITYSIPSSGTLELTYPEGISSAERRALVTMFATDVIETVNALFPEAAGPVTVTHSYAGYSLSAEIGEGSAAVAYPDVVTAAEVEGFIAAVNLEYGDTLGGVFYSIEGPGQAVFTYPESVGFAEASAFASILVSTLVSYIG